MNEVVCVNVAVGELVPSEAATGLEPAVPAGTIIVAENLPLEPDTTGEMGEIGFPPNVKLIECNGIKLEPVIVIVVPVGSCVGDNIIDEVDIVKVSNARLVPSEAATE